ncbi:MAG: hypothetical protein JXQ82_07840 [Methanomicrobiaceae archaeon]|nr:hypothetical protein [Methanomicrobiaceae archaeon]
MSPDTQQLMHIRQRQAHLKEDMSLYGVKTPTELPLKTILYHRAVRLSGGVQ